MLSICVGQCGNQILNEFFSSTNHHHHVHHHHHHHHHPFFHHGEPFSVRVDSAAEPKVVRTSKKKFKFKFKFKSVTVNAVDRRGTVRESDSE